MSRYKRPSWAARHILNPLIAWPAKLGLSLRGANVLTVRGRATGQQRSVPVNPLFHDGQRYLVAPRGDTHWARNLRSAGEGELRLGRRRERIHVAEVPDIDKPPIIRSYLKRWAAETKSQFGIESADISEGELRSMAPRHPVFRILTP